VGEREQPSNLLIKLSHRLFKEAGDRDQFIQHLTQPTVYNTCLLWRDPRPQDRPFVVEPPLFWQPPFVDRLAPGQRPGQHALHAAGAYYCLDFSSVFAISSLLAIAKPIDLVLDMCASPGGKSVFAWVALQPQLLLSNEVIGKRMAQLLSNLKRCRIHPAIALRLDSKILAEAIPNTLPLVLVDAPCSGQSLLAKGGKAPGCFHPVTIKNNASRQKRILANAAQIVAPGGYIAYTTCTYSPEENEQVVEWLIKKFPCFQPVKVEHLQDFQSQLVDFPCYRIFPQSGLGAGAFSVLLQNSESGEPAVISPDFLTQPGMITL